MRIGIDLGGTKIEALALSNTGDEIFRRRIATPRGDYAAIVNAIVELVAQVEHQLEGENTLGICIPGTVSPASGLVKNANTTELIGQPLAKDLQAALKRPVRISNDANCFALSEAVDGAASAATIGQALEVVFGVILGTGVGGGLVVHGQVLEGVDSIAGEWGHNPLPWQNEKERDVPPCWCQRHGCIETFLSGPALERQHFSQTRVASSAKEIGLAAESGDAAARTSLEQYADRLARALATVINVINPDVIVLGGGVSNLQSLYRDVPDAWQQYVFSDVVSTRLVQAKHGDSSGVRGAAWLWPKN